MASARDFAARYIVISPRRLPDLAPFINKYLNYSASNYAESTKITHVIKCYTIYLTLYAIRPFNSPIVYLTP
jgi:hypothetical protein